MTSSPRDALRRLLPNDPELKPYLPGLYFSFFNALTWQIAIGTPLVLLVEALGGTSAQTGLAAGFVFLLTPVQLFATLLVPRFGYKRLTLAGWSWRSYMLVVPIGVCLLVPHLGVRDWMVVAVIASTFVFCGLRSMGLAASLPWFFAMIPKSKRGAFFGSDHLMAGVASLLTLLVSVASFSVLSSFAALALQFGVALAGSALAVASLRRLPDVPAPPLQGLGEMGRRMLALLAHRSGFGGYFWVTVICYLASTPLAPFVAYHLRSDVGCSNSLIMILECCRYLGSVAAAGMLRRRVDHLGARPFLIVSLGLYAALGAWWAGSLVFEWRGILPWTICYVAMGAASTAWLVGNLSFLPKLLGEEERMLGVTLHSVAASLTGGVSIVVWGWWLRPGGGATGLNPSLFTWMLGLMFGLSLAAAGALSRIREPDTHPRVEFEPLALVLKPHRALAALIRLPVATGADQPSRR